RLVGVERGGGEWRCLPFGRGNDRRAVRIYPLRCDDLAVMSVAGRVLYHVALAFVEVVEGDSVPVRYEAPGRREVAVVTGNLGNARLADAALKKFVESVAGSGRIRAQREIGPGWPVNAFGGHPALQLAVHVEPRLVVAVVDTCQVDQLVSRQ